MEKTGIKMVKNCVKPVVWKAVWYFPLVSFFLNEKKITLQDNHDSTFNDPNDYIHFMELLSRTCT